jgi:hypothetical protein
VSTASRCPTPCDSDCEATCHEVHLPRWKRTHAVVASGFQILRGARTTEDPMLTGGHHVETEIVE